MDLFALDKVWKTRLEKMWAWQRRFSASGDGVTFKNNEDSPTLTVRQQPGKGTTAKSPLLLARITSVSGSGASAKYAWEQVRPLAAGGVEAVPGGQTGLTTDDSYARDPNNQPLGIGSTYPLRREARDDGKTAWLAVAPPPGTVYRCDLAPAGGTNGADDGSTGPSYAYAITYKGVPLPGSYQPEDRPFATGKVEDTADAGTFCVDADGTVHLLTANETWQRGPCTSS